MWNSIFKAEANVQANWCTAWSCKDLFIQCHMNLDAFVIKFLLILLMTYYTVDSDSNEKIYLIAFFKEKHYIWKDESLWESILVESVYS